MNSRKGFSAGSSLLVFIIIWLFMAFALSFWTDSNLDYWTTVSHGMPNDVPFGYSFLISLFVPVVLVLNICASIARLFV